MQLLTVDMLVPVPQEAGFEKAPPPEYTPDDTLFHKEERSPDPERNRWSQSDTDAGVGPAEFPCNSPHKCFGRGQSHVCLGYLVVQSSRLYERERERERERTPFHGE